MNLIYLMFVSFNMVHSKKTILPQVSNKTEVESISKCFIMVINEMRLHKPTIVILKNNTKKFIEEEMFVRNMIKVFGYRNIPLVVLEDLDYLVENNDLHEGNLIAIIYFDSCKALSHFNSYTIDDDIKYLVITPPCRELVNLVDKFQNDHVTFVVKENDGKHKFVTIVPEIDYVTCQLRVGLKPKTINTCFEGKLAKNKIFPNKIPQNLKGCYYKVGVMNSFPFASVKHTDSLSFMDPVDKLEGMDVEMMKIVAKELNVTLKYYYVFNLKEDPLDYNFFELLVNGTLDACVGGLHRSSHDDVSYSGLYARQSVMWIYTAKREERCWNDFVKSLLDEIYMFTIVHISYSLVWNLVCTYDGNVVYLGETLLYSWGALISAGSLPKARSAKQKILNISYLFLSIYMTFYMNTQLYSFLTVQDPPEILNTNEAIMQSGRPAYLRRHRKIYVEDLKYRAFANRSEKCDSILDCEMKVIANKGVTIVRQGDFYALQSLTTIHNEATILRTADNILTLFPEVVIRKYSPVLKKFRHVITSLSESGITGKLYKNAVGITAVEKAKIAAKNIMSNTYICKTGCPITLFQIAGLFYIWLIGCSLSCCVLVIEMISNQSKFCLSLT